MTPVWPAAARCHRALEFFDINGPAKRIARVVIDYSLGLEPAQLEMRAAGFDLFLKETNLSKGRVCTALADLEKLRIVAVRGAASEVRRYSFQDDWRRWKCPPLRKEWGDEVSLALLIDGHNPWQRYTLSLTAHGDAGMLFPDDVTLDLAIIELRRQSPTVPGPGTVTRGSVPGPGTTVESAKPAAGLDDIVPGPGTGPGGVPGKEVLRTLVPGIRTGTGMSYPAAAAGVPGPGTAIRDLLDHARQQLGATFVAPPIGHGGLLVCFAREDYRATWEAISELRLRRERLSHEPLKDEVQWFKHTYRLIRNERQAANK